MKNKPIIIKNFIEVYFIKDDTFFMEIGIDEIPMEQIKKIIIPKKDDPECYNPYQIDTEMSIKINRLLEEKVVFDFDTYEYYFQRLDVSFETNRI